MSAPDAAARALPRPPRRHQIRHLRNLFRDPRPVLESLRDAHGPIVGLGARPASLAIVGDPAALRELFALPTRTFRWGHRFNVLGFVVGPQSMIVSDGDDHRRRRSSVQAAFSRRRLNGWIPMILERTDDAIDRLGTSTGATPREVDLYRVGKALVFEITLRALFGSRLAGRSAELVELFQRSQDYLESPAVRQLPHPIPFTRRARVRADRRTLDAVIDTEIAACRAHPTGDPHDVLEVLVSDGSLTDSEIRDQVVTLMGAGYDTTSASLAWMLWCSVLCPGLWERLRAEADQVLGPPGSTVDETALASLELARRVMQETTRLHPAGSIALREAVEDIVLGGYRIPAGTLIVWSAHLAGRDRSAWADPLRFDPDRFADASQEQRALADIAWVPFGRGPRNCIGFALAQMELTLIIARLAQRLDVATTAEEPPRAVGMVVNRPTGGVPMQVSPRASA